MMKPLKALPKRLMRSPAITELTGMHRVELHRKVKAGLFPQPIRLGPKSFAWPEEEILAWLNEQRAPSPKPKRGTYRTRVALPDNAA